jgi:hypothetical protein
MRRFVAPLSKSAQKACVSAAALGHPQPCTTVRNAARADRGPQRISSQYAGTELLAATVGLSTTLQQRVQMVGMSVLGKIPLQYLC